VLRAIERKSKTGLVKKSNYSVRTYSFTWSTAPFQMNHDGIERSSTSVTNDNRFQVLPSSSSPEVRDSVSDEARSCSQKLHSRTSQWRFVNRQSSTVNIVVYELLICKLKEFNSIA